MWARIPIQQKESATEPRLRVASLRVVSAGNISSEAYIPGTVNPMGRNRRTGSRIDRSIPRTAGGLARRRADRSCGG